MTLASHCDPAQESGVARGSPLVGALAIVLVGLAVAIGSCARHTIPTPAPNPQAARVSGPAPTPAAIAAGPKPPVGWPPEVQFSPSPRPSPVPLLNSVKPTTVAPGQTLTLRGSRFGPSVVVLLEQPQLGTSSLWQGKPSSDGEISFTVPKRVVVCFGGGAGPVASSPPLCGLIPGDFCIDVPVNGMGRIGVATWPGRLCSSTVVVDVIVARSLPYLDSIAPTSAKTGQSVTLRGSGFGKRAEVVAFQQATEVYTLWSGKPSRDGTITFRLPKRTLGCIIHDNCGLQQAVASPSGPIKYRIRVRVWGTDVDQDLGRWPYRSLKVPPPPMTNDLPLTVLPSEP